MTMQAVLDAEALLAAFDAQDGTFARAFFKADRDILGAMVAYASFAMLEVAAREDADLASVRQAFRLHLSDLQARNDQKEG